MRKNKLFLIKSCFVYFIAYFIYASIFTQYIPYLTSLGYTASERGIMVSAYAVTNILFQFLFGYLSDKYRKAKTMLTCLVVITVLIGALFYSIDTKIFLIQSGFIALSGGLVFTNYGILDNWLFGYGDEARKQFSFIRAFGSLGWAVASLSIASVIKMFTYKGLSVFIFLVLLLLIAGLNIINDKTEEVKRSAEKIRFSDIKELMIERKYCMLIVILFLLSCAGMCSSTAVVEKMQILNATGSQIGFKWAVCAIAELPVYIYGYKFMKKFGAYKLLIIAAVFNFMQYFLFSVVNSVNGIIIISSLQMLNVPLYNLASRMLFFEYSTEKLRTSSLMFALSIYQGISMLIMPVISGYITEYYNVSITLFSVSICSLAAVVLSYILLRWNKEEKKNDSKEDDMAKERVGELKVAKSTF